PPGYPVLNRSRAVPDRVRSLQRSLCDPPSPWRRGHRRRGMPRRLRGLQDAAGRSLPSVRETRGLSARLSAARPLENRRILPQERARGSLRRPIGPTAVRLRRARTERVRKVRTDAPARLWQPRELFRPRCETLPRIAAPTRTEWL